MVFLSARNFYSIAKKNFAPIFFLLAYQATFQSLRNQPNKKMETFALNEIRRT